MPFISIHLSSNRPKEFTELLDNLEATAYDPSRVEVIVRIDDGDEPMQQLVRQEQKSRRLQLKFLSMPFTGFEDLYKSFDEIHYRLCDPSVYFVQHINDELRHVIPHWDKILEDRYTGLFEDGIYRLRLSMYKLWNYNGIEECGPHPENIPIVTKKWIDLTGWCPCHSADSFQQMLAYYLGKADDAGNRFYRDIPIFDIRMEGLEAGVGLITPEEIKLHNDRAVASWKILFGDAMRVKAQEKANILRAHIKCHQRGISDFSISHDADATHVWDASSNHEILSFPILLPAAPLPAQPQVPLPAPPPALAHAGRAIPLCVRTVRFARQLAGMAKRSVKFVLAR